MKTLLIFAALVQIALAQPRDRLSGRIQNTKVITLRGMRNPRIKTLTDEGPIDDNQRIAGLRFRFRPTAAQSAALEQLLEDQQNPSSLLYHAWLTPEEFGDRFGVSENDLNNVKDWLAAQRFQIEHVARSRTYVVFSATAGQIRNAFHTELIDFALTTGATLLT
jgi:hypothetical protein